MAQKELFINSIRQVRIEGHSITPTIVLYRDRSHLVGHEAIEACEDPAQLKEDFKVELGKDDPVRTSQQRDRSAGRSVVGITKDFIDTIISKANTIIETHGVQAPSRIIVAEPLTLSEDEVARDDWLKNYRAAIKRILTGKFEQIDFMPEPFAVFQYYRYGIKHPLVAQKAKHVALVFDFGGGTFDASVIETTAAGDISNGGRNSRPLAAKSVPVGGFFINRQIAEYLLFKTLGKGVDKSSVRRALDAYSTLKNADDEALASARPDHAIFARHFRRLMQSVEQAKLSICSGIADWRLNADLRSAPAYRIDVPLSPLSEETQIASVRLDALEVRQVFEERVWRTKLLPTITDTIRRAEKELSGKPISIILLSGGSSNIKWFKPLLLRDLSFQIKGAEILELNENFQEIVSKGLAVECARRFYNEGDGDFRAVTYNQLCLSLDPNGSGVELKRYTPESDLLSGIESDSGILLPSSTSLRNFVGEPLRWKVKLSRAPTQSLDYYFMRSSFDHEDMQARHNLDDRVLTPRDATFGATVGVELVVREDGTAEPAFLYGRGQQGRTSVVKGRPFYLDMTYATDDVGTESYLGLDFGTSTTSMCYVDANDIKVYAERASNRTWLGLSSLVEVLPYPVAFPLARFLSETTIEQMESRGREAFEAILTFAAYLAYVEHCSFASTGSLFKALRQRSAGPLWALLKECASQTGVRWTRLSSLNELVSGQLREEIDNAVGKVALSKHGKRAGDLDYPRLLEATGNVIARCMSGKLFGYFDESRKKPFSMNTFQGVFRNAVGPSTTFIDVFEYEGSDAFPSEYVFLLDLEGGAVIPMFPLYARGLESGTRPSGDPDIYLFDIVKGDDVIFRAVQERDEIEVNRAFPELYKEIAERIRQDRPTELVKPVEVQPRRTDS